MNIPDAADRFLRRQHGAKTGKSKLGQEPADGRSDRPSDAKWFTVKALIPLSAMRHVSTCSRHTGEKVAISQLLG